jgi:hypothetical protein
MPFSHQKTKDQKMLAFKETIEGFGRRFKSTSLEIQRKQNLHSLYSSSDSHSPPTDYTRAEE